MASSVYGVTFDPFAAGALSPNEKAEIQRFIRVLDYEKHSGAEHRAVGCLMRLWNALESADAKCSLCSIEDGLVREWVMKARAVARGKGLL